MGLLTSQGLTSSLSLSRRSRFVCCDGGARDKERERGGGLSVDFYDNASPAIPPCMCSMIMAALPSRALRPGCTPGGGRWAIWSGLVWPPPATRHPPPATRHPPLTARRGNERPRSKKLRSLSWFKFSFLRALGGPFLTAPVRELRTCGMCRCCRRAAWEGVMIPSRPPPAFCTFWRPYLPCGRHQRRINSDPGALLSKPSRDTLQTFCAGPDRSRGNLLPSPPQGRRESCSAWK